MTANKISKPSFYLFILYPSKTGTLVNLSTKCHKITKVYTKKIGKFAIDMACCKKTQNRAVQKVVIPKGMINPGETTIIEIPSCLQRQPIVIAKRKTSLESVSFTKPNRKTQNKAIKQEANVDKKLVQKGLLDDIDHINLDDTEKKEREQFIKDLEEFQKARRKLLANASFLTGEKQKQKQ